MSAPAYGYRGFYCGVSEARGKMRCSEQCDECREYEEKEAGKDEDHNKDEPDRSEA